MSAHTDDYETIVDAYKAVYEDYLNGTVTQAEWEAARAVFIEGESA